MYFVFVYFDRNIIILTVRGEWVAKCRETAARLTHRCGFFFKKWVLERPYITLAGVFLRLPPGVTLLKHAWASPSLSSWSPGDWSSFFGCMALLTPPSQHPFGLPLVAELRWRRIATSVGSFYYSEALLRFMDCDVTAISRRLVSKKSLERPKTSQDHSHLIF